MMGKSSPKAPAAPDPNVVASAQTQQNKDTAIANAALNRINQVTPWGNLTYTQNGVDANGIPQYTQTIELSPDQQKLLQSNNQISQAMSDLGMNQIGNVSNVLGKPFDYSGAPAQVTNIDKTRVQTPWDAGNISNSLQSAGSLTRDVANSGGITGSVANAGGINRNLSTGGPLRTGAQYGSIQNDVDMSKVPELIGGDKLAEDLATQRDALYRQNAAFLDPQWRQDQTDLENKLIQQGIAQNSDAWNRAIGDFSRNKEFAYSNARNQSITGGGTEQSRLFGLGLSANQNAYYQALNNAQFHNAAQQQGFGQSMSNAQLNNAAMGQQFGQNLAGAQFGNAAQAQQYGQNLSDAQFANSAQGQQFGQNLAGAQLNNAAQGQQFGQNLAGAQFGNTAQQQMYDQLMRSQGTQFDQALVNANLQNQGRNQYINEQNYLRQQPLNELNALRSGSQVTAPQFSGVPQVAMGGTDVAGLYNNQYQNQLANYNAQVAGNNAMTGGLFGLGAAALGAPSTSWFGKLFG
jgi:hypothetical protein